MRLCDEYVQRMGLPKLILRHASKFFLFFNDGDRLLSCRWIHSSNSCGYYEFSECILEKNVKVVRKESVEWDCYEDFLFGWLSSHRGFVFSKDKIFDLSWVFFVRRHDHFLASNFDPAKIYDSLDASNDNRIIVALELVEKISNLNVEAYDFWNSRAGEIISRYAHWFSGFSVDSFPCGLYNKSHENNRSVDG